jgi:recombinational DNA repair protein RecT
MARKTCLLRLAAWLPKSTEMAYAIEVDNGVRTNVDPSASLTEVTHHYEQVPDDETVQGETVTAPDDVPDPHDGNDPWVKDGEA